MPDDEFKHFLQAQEPGFDQVVAELTEGQKQTHWMWFIFPQIQGLGHSPMVGNLLSNPWNKPADMPNIRNLVCVSVNAPGSSLKFKAGMFRKFLAFPTTSSFILR